MVTGDIVDNTGVKTESRHQDNRSDEYNNTILNKPIISYWCDSNNNNTTNGNYLIYLGMDNRDDVPTDAQITDTTDINGKN